MRKMKDGKATQVRIGYDGKVYKVFRGPKARERFENEVAILRYLEKKGCPFVPRIIEVKEDELFMVTSNCGSIVDQISDEKLRSLFLELEQYGVRHEDPFARNVTYSAQLGRFCLIDFEFATNLETGVGLTLEDVEGKKEEPK